jgi:hypothetical protein
MFLVFEDIGLTQVDKNGFESSTKQQWREIGSATVDGDMSTLAAL